MAWTWQMAVGHMNNKLALIRNMRTLARTTAEANRLAKTLSDISASILVMASIREEIDARGRAEEAVRAEAEYIVAVSADARAKVLAWQEQEKLRIAETAKLKADEDGGLTAEKSAIADEPKPKGILGRLFDRVRRNGKA